MQIKMQCNKTVILFWAVFTVLSVFSGFAQTSGLAEVYAQIDSAFTAKSEEKLNGIFVENRGSPDFRMYENYTMKKIRQLVINNQFEFARAACLVVIDADMDNSGAISMYSVIDDGIAKQQADAEALAKKKAAEEARLAYERQKVLQQAQTKYQTVNTSSGKSVYLNENQARYTKVAWRLAFGMADIEYIKVTPGDYASVRYGIMSDVSMQYQTDQILFGIEGTAELFMMTMSNSDGTLLSAYKIVPKMAFTDLNSHVFFRTGAAAYVTGKGEEENKEQGTFITPIAGLSIENITVGDSLFRMYYDYYFGHFAYTDLKSAMEAGAFITMPVAELDKARVGFDVGIKDTLFITDGGMDNRVRAVFAIGVGNVVK